MATTNGNRRAKSVVTGEDTDAAADAMLGDLARNIEEVST
jgi:hypothetical protein